MSDKGGSVSFEIERKFLIASLPGLVDDGETIEQGYLPISEEGVEVRIRRRGSSNYLAVKSGSGLVRTECEEMVSRDLFEALWPLTQGRRTSKTRHHIAFSGLIIELDVFSGRLAGLMVAEVEFPDTAAAAAFVPPLWLGQEVTNDPSYSNRSLAN